MKDIGYANAVAACVGVTLVCLGLSHTIANNGSVFASIAFGLVCLLPLVLRVRNIAALPSPLVLLMALSVGLHVYGLASGAYVTSSWYDTLTHILSSTTVGMLVFYAMICIQHYGGRKVNFTGTGLSIIVALIGVTFGTYWEILEYLSDKLTDTLSQYSPYDTVTDLICDAIGTAIASLWVRVCMWKYTSDEIAESFRLDRKLRKLAYSDEE